MTATATVQTEIQRFLRGTDPEVLCVTGKWGVGKTYLWKKEVESAQAAETIQLKRYAYVSLFGQNSLDALKSAIVEESVDVGTIGKWSEITSITLPKLLKSTVTGWSSRIGRLIPGVREYVIDASGLLFSLLVRNQIICIDDLDRVGTELSAKDVLGLVSFLKEERKCRVVILLNEEQLREDNKIDFSEQIEKVIDVKLEFRPTPLDAARTAITGQSEAERLLASHSEKLGLTNIRVIQKIRRLAIRLEELLQDFDEVVLQQAIHSVTLFGWITFQPNMAPPLSLITDYNPWEHVFDDQKEPDEKEAAWRALLRSYNFSRIDEFDEVILDGVQRGFFEVTALKQRATLVALQIASNRQKNSLQEAWQLFYHSFSFGAEEVLKGLKDAFLSALPALSLGDLSGTVDFFKKLHATQSAHELIEAYFEEHKEQPRDFFDIKQYPFGISVKDPDVRAAMAKKHASFGVVMQPFEVLKSLSERDGWNPEEITLLANVTPEEFETIFRNATGIHLGAIIKRALEFGTYGGATEEMRRITQAATKALRNIEAESEINRLRVAYFGLPPKLDAQP